jgi:hypothetical protein
VGVNPLSDKDVDRIARRLAWKLIVYGLLIFVTLWIAQYVVFAVVALLSAGTNGNPFIVLLPVATSLLAVPAILLIWIWGRSNRSR